MPCTSQPFSTRLKGAVLPCVILIQLLVGPLILMACSDEPDEPTTRSGQPAPAPSSLPSQTGAAPALPAVPSPTPTYTPLPVTPTPPPTPLPPATTGGKAGGAVLTEALTLHPYKRNNQTGQKWVQLLYAASLARRDPKTLEPVPAAAENWTVSDTTVTFLLKPGLKWSDGRPLTTADYLWTYQQARKPENGWPLASAAFAPAAPATGNGIESYEALDARTLKIRLRSAVGDLISQADVIEPLPRHIWERLDWNDPARNPQINAPTVVSGPWKLKEWKRANLATFEANAASSVYPVARLDSLTFYVLPDSQVALQKVKNGEVDFFEPAPADYRAFAQLPGVQGYTWGPARPEWYYVGFNFRKPDLQDKKFRQALALATDRPGILNSQGFGFGQLINSSVSPWHPAFTALTARYPFSPDKGRELLREAGYALKNGKLVNKSGNALPPLKLIYNMPSPLYDGVASTIKANLAEIGLELNLVSYDFGNFKRILASQEADYDLFLSGWTGDYAPENFGEIWRGGPEYNSGNFENPRLLDMYAKAQGESDPTRRKEWLAQVQSLEAEELPYIFLYARQGGMVANKRLAGMIPGLLGPDQNLYTDWFAIK